MARKFNTEDIERLKKNISILHVCADHGIELKHHGTHDYIGHCPFHDDEKPSFVVTPSKNLWHCMGCASGGSVIDLVMKFEGITFRDAVDKLLTSTGLIARGTTKTKKEVSTVTSCTERGHPLEVKSRDKESSCKDFSSLNFLLTPRATNQP